MNKLSAMQVEHQTEKKQFILKINETEQAFIKYIQLKDSLQLIYTEVPLNHRRKGYGKELVNKTIEYLKERQIKFVPVCGFIRSYIAHKNRMENQ
jgi:predicted GNAT family acetyltransferase